MWSIFNPFMIDFNPRSDINLLLLGETGAGKSTLINSISNYFNYPNFKEAQKEKIDILIPVLLNTMESSNVSSQNEDKLHGENKRTTQYGKVYLFPIKMDDKTFDLKLIDTPGIEDRRGMEQNNLILDNILAYLKRQGKLHAICLVLKANQTRITNSVEYYLKYILTRLDERPSQNIIFITTYSKAAGYTAGETKHHCLIPLVKNIQSKPPHVSIPLSDNNIFAVDNEAFNALLAMQDGNYYHQQAMEGFEQSWNVSSKEIQRLLRYIVGGCRNALLRTHVVESINSQTESRPFSLPEESPTTVDEINLLLFGETGVGKSTLINSILNYFIYPNFKDAQKGKIDILIPKRLRLTEDSSESATQRVKVYSFPIQMCQKIFNLRLIDTPSVEDSRGIVQNNINMDNIFAYVATLKKLHGICFVLKSHGRRFNKFQEYCLKQILTRLDKSASQNIIFITTYSIFYPDEVKKTRERVLVPLVRNILSKPPHVSIPLNDNNIFTLNNETTQVLLKLQEGGYHSPYILNRFAQSWDVSSKEFQRLLTYIIGDLKDDPLEPHEVESTVNINEARFLVEQLTASNTKLSELIKDIIRLLDGCKKHLDLVDQEKKNAIRSKDDVRIHLEEMIKDLSKRRSELEEEGETISKIIAKFSYFLQEHALMPFNDTYNDYIEQLIKNEKKDKKNIYKHKKLLRQHQNLQKTVQESAKKFQKEAASSNLTAQEIQNSITELYSLKHMGKSIRELTEKSWICRDKAQKKRSKSRKDLNTDSQQASQDDLQKITLAADDMQTELANSEDGSKEHQKTEHSELNESETISKDVESATHKESPENELVYKVTYTYRTNDSEDDKSLKPRTDDASNSRHNTGLRPEKPSPERTYNDPREPRHSDARYHSEEDNRLAEASGSRNHPTRSNFSPRSTSPGRYHYTTERKSHRRDHRTHYSPRRYRRPSESHDSSDRDFRRSSRRHTTRYTDESESYDSDDNPSRNRTRSKSYKDYDSSHDRHKKSRHVKNKSSRRRRSSDEDTIREKKSHRRQHKGKRSSRRHRRSNESYDSDDDESRRSSSSGSASSARSFDSRSSNSHDNQSDGSLGSENSVDSSKQTGSKSYKVNDSDDDRPKKTNRAKNNSSRQARDVEYDDTTTGTKSRNKTDKKLEDSSWQRHHRSESYDSDNCDHIKSSRKGHTTTSKDKSSVKHHLDDRSTKNPVKQSKNPKKSKSANKNHDSDADRPTQSSKSGRNVPKADSETRDHKSTRSSRSKHAKPADSKTPRKSSPVDKSNERDTYDTKLSRKERGTKEREFESQKNPKSEENLSDSSSSDELRDTKPEKQKESKSGSSQNAKRYEVSSTSTSSNGSSSFETHTVVAKNSESSESDSESYEGTESGGDFETVLS
ncbi:hypothetical protein Zmor_015087 [Zophobas morio]|uniref:G domain-containing protein n=1 Tax=Zophobas morio TaxID=2755281 RepID=A0AA38IGM1_9CUCU|nr:hypothetical protein Zmor_015087 [Zophobas morio]